MTMRSYSGLLVLENIFDYIPTFNPDLVNFSLGVFNPNVGIVKQDCGTTLGSIQPVNYGLEGKVELATDTIISKSRIDQLLFSGTYSVATRSLDTCVAPGGICQKCYAASRQELPIPSVGSRVTILPEYSVKTTILSGVAGQSVYALDLNSTQYQTTSIYINGSLIDPTTYSISGSTLTFNQGISQEENVVVHYKSLNRSPFLVWLASTYSGSLLGMKPLPAPMLPIRSELLASLVPLNRLDLLISYTDGITIIPEVFRQYLPQVKHPLEKSLYMLALNSAFTNVAI